MTAAAFSGGAGFALDRARVSTHLRSAGGAGRLVDDLVAADLSRLLWLGGPADLAEVAVALSRRATGEVEFLTVRGPDREPLATAGVDFAAVPGAGTVWQVVSHPNLWGLGLASALLAAAEARVRARGVRRVRLNVELGNVRAYRLYTRLGFVVVGYAQAARPVHRAGTGLVRAAACATMEKPLLG